MTTRIRRRGVLVPVLGVALITLIAGGVALIAQSKRDFDVVARKYSFRVNGGNAEIKVLQNELVHITFSTDDIPHSFTIKDEGGSTYRIMKRAEKGKPISFEFRADTPGRFTFYCSLTEDDKCRDMQGTLVVEKTN